MGGLVVLLILMGVGALVFAIVYNKSSKSNSAPPISPPQPAQPLSPPVKPAPTAPVAPQNFVSVYTFDDSTPVWRCPTCDGELSPSAPACRICGQKIISSRR